MFGIEPLARIVRHDARIEVKVPAAKGKKAYSYFREGGEGEKKSSGVGKKVALVGGGLALAGLGAAAIAMSRKKTETGGIAAPVSEPKKIETGGVAAPVSEPKKIEKNNTARNVAIEAGVAGLGVAAKMATSKKEIELEKSSKKEPEPEAPVTKKNAAAIALLPPAKEKAEKKRPRQEKEDEVINNGVIIVGGKQEDPSPKKVVTPSPPLVKAIPVLGKDPDLLQQIGEGNFGVVHTTSKGTAFKRVKDDQTIEPEEVSIAYRLGEKGIGAKILGVRKDGEDIVGIEMEYLKDHRPLFFLLKEAGQKKDRVLMDKYFDSALISVAKMHEEGVFHGDLHSMNMMQKDGVTKIIDFGLSEEFRDKNTPSSSDIGKWKIDVENLWAGTFLREFGRLHETEPWKVPQLETPIQLILKESLALAKKDREGAYKYYKKEMSKYV